MAMSRRSFLRGSSGGLAFMAAAATLKRWVGEADAATLGGYAGYRAAVCVFLLGGNDSNNVLVPTATNASGTGAYDHYKRARPTLALPLDGGSLTISPGTATNAYMLHPSLQKLQQHFEDGHAAFVCNVGPLSLPTNKALYASGGYELPRNLFSHSDQQDAWASAVSDPLRIVAPGAGPTGWGGRMADKITGLNSAGGYPEVTSFGGKALFAAGVTRKPLIVSPSGVLALSKITSNAAFDDLRREALAGVLGIDDGIALAQGYGDTFTTALTYSAQRDTARNDAWSSLPVATRDAIDALFVAPAGHPTWTLHTQLYQVVRDLVAGAMATNKGGLGMKREVFSVGFGSFDTHAGQAPTHADKLAELDFAMDAFHQAMALLAPKMGPNPPQATLFTMSDFSRTLAENSDGGTDHGWGGHAIVLGERVNGKKIFGRFPNLDLTVTGGQVASPDTTDVKGRWIPAVSVEQYANGIAYWLGLTTGAERSYLFPNLSRYVTAASDTTVWASNLYRSYRIGFMQADA
jgi:uncharacterized protein (DUF1501 family)